MPGPRGAPRKVSGGPSFPLLAFGTAAPRPCATWLFEEILISTQVIAASQVPTPMAWERLMTQRETRGLQVALR